MTLAQRLTALINAIGADYKDQNTRIGALSALNTTAKGSLVAAINEVLAAIGGAGAQINDSAIATTTTYSSTKIEALVDAGVAEAVAQILGGASAAYDTLIEIQTILGGQDNSLTNLLAAVNNRVRFDAAQSLTAGQKAQACENIGIGDPDTDLVALYNAAKA